MNKSIRLSLIIVIILFLTGIILYPKIKPLIQAKAGKQQGGMPARQGQQKLFASGYIIVPEKLSELVNTIGTLRPDEEVDLSFETSGKIVAIYFQEGTKVKKGDLIAKINDRPLQAQLEKLMAQKKLAEQKEFRQRNLLDRDAISQESYDQIQTELQTIQADINLVSARISETELRAPFDGILGLKYFSEGAYATPSTKFARLVKITPIKLDFSIPQRYAPEIKTGFPLTFKVEGIDKTFEANVFANVYAIDPKIEISTRTISLRAIYPNKNEELMPGMFAQITLQLSQVDNAISIPTEALIPEMEGEKVFVYRNGKAQSVRVTTGLRTESRIQITEGLNFGDTLLITGILQLRQSLPIQLDTVITNK